MTGKKCLKDKNSNFFENKALPYIFLLPALILLVLFILFPMFKAVYLSFFKWNGIGSPQFIGIKNYVDLFKSSKLWSCLSHTFIYAFSGVTLTVVIGLALAYAIERRVKGWQIYKFVFYISVMLSVTVVAMLFIQIFEPNFGLLNVLLDKIGLSSLKHSWLSDSKTALGCVIAVSTWQYSGFTMLLFLAAMESIDPAIHEAATIDGVDNFKRFFTITLPIIKRPLFVVIMLQMIFSFKTFDIFWIMTDGGPAGKTETITTFLYRNAMKYGKYGTASAIGVIMIIIISILSIFYIKGSHLSDQVIE